MKIFLFVMMMIAAVAFYADDALADQKYVESSGSSIFTIDREAGTITRQIRASIQATPLQSETLSCKYGYIATIIGESVSMLDLLAPLNGTQANNLAMKRVEAARTDCQKYNMEVRF